MTDSQQVETSNKKLAAGLLAIFLGSLGIHKLLLVTVLTCGFGASVMGIIGVIEGVLYLTKSTEEFQAQYIDATREWF